MTSIRSTLVAGATAALVLGGLGTPTAVAEPVGGDQAGVSPLGAVPEPMPQTNNTVYALGYAGGVLYLGGTFTQARPAGSPPGSDAVDRPHLAAVDTTTGQLLASWAPQVTGGSVFAMSVSPDKTRLYVGGSFTKVDGLFRSRLAAFDITDPRHPALLPTSAFKASVNGKVAAMDSTGSALYVGGYFGTASGSSRSKLAAFTPAGLLLPWQPSVAGTSNTTFYPQPFVTAVLADQQGHVAVGGMFDQVNGVAQHGLGLVDATTGASVPGFTPPGIQPLSYVVAMRFSGNRLFISGRDDKSGTRARLEGVTALDATTGQTLWGSDYHRCMGDTFALMVLHGQVWAGTHAHDCSDVGTYPEKQPRFYGAVLGQNTATGEQVPFYPSVSGSKTAPGSYDNVRAFETDGSRLFVAGGFLKVNGVAQQDLTAFDLHSQSSTTPRRVARPTAASATVGARISWRATDDIDDRQLTYNVYRGSGTTPVGTVSAASAFWNHPVLSFHDTTAVAGTSVTYRVEATDGATSAAKSLPSVAVTAGVGPASYEAAVLADHPAFYWQFEESGGSTVADSSGNGDDGNLTKGDLSAGGVEGSGLAMSGDDHAYESVTRTNPFPYSLELWFASTSTSGGKLIGFGNSASGVSSQYDRHVFMTDAGNLVFGAYPGSTQTVSSPATYNDGAWHHVVATQGTDGMSLYVDGVLVGHSSVGSAEGYTGRFRVGGDNLNGWPDQPSSRGLDATVDEAAVYLTELTPDAVQTHYDAR